MSEELTQSLLNRIAALEARVAYLEACQNSLVRMATPALPLARMPVGASVDTVNPGAHPAALREVRPVRTQS